MDTSLRVRRRHRSWPEELKREIVAASLAPGASVSVVARQYDVNTNLVFSWRKRYGEAPNGASVPQLVPVVVTPDRVGQAAPATGAGSIEIELENSMVAGPIARVHLIPIVLDADRCPISGSD
jgi:transposase